MALRWVHESPPHWDAGKAEIVGGAPPGVFHIGDYRPGELVPGEWWRVEDDGSVLGYGWMDTTWGDAEVLLAVAPTSRKQGVGTFILEHLADEALARGLNYLYNVVPEAHPERKALARWLKQRGFEPSGEGGLLRRPVRSTAGRSGDAPERTPV